MGKVEIRYYVTRRAWKNSRATWGYWIPSKKMRAAGFAIVACGEDGPAAWAIAQRLNEKWDAVKKGGAKTAGTAKAVPHSYPAGALGAAFAAFRGTNTWRQKKPRTREDWERGWKHIEPIFGDVVPSSIALDHLDAWYAALLNRVGVREAARAMKIWRALWGVAASMKYCERDADPSLAIRVKTPTPRNAFWTEGEAVRLVKGAWRMHYRGLATALAVAWDTMLSPVDVTRLTLARYDNDTFSVDRAKTGKAAIGTLSRRTRALLSAYLAALPFRLHPETPIFHTRGTVAGARGGRPQQPKPYSRPMLGEDFRAVRAAIFPGDARQIMDFRRSGAIEATVGEVDPGALAGKMANSIDRSRKLQETYQPKTAQLVRLADVARTRGRARLRGGK